MANTFIVLVGILMSICRWQTATAFAPSNIIRSHHQQQQHASAPTPLSALVYHPDDNSNGYEDADDIFGQSALSSGVDHFVQLAGQLSSDPAITSTLAKLASAFSPPGFAIDLSNVNNVRCSSLDNRHMEIEAVVCDDLECSSLLVPVDFPEECVDDESLVECIIRNVYHLDATGEHLLRERDHVFAQEAEAQRAYEVLQSLDSEYLKSSTTPASLPEWWVPPNAAEDITECNLLQALLNGDDLQGMMRGLAMHVLLHGSHDYFGVEGNSLVVRTVHVKAVGPVGMVLKVQCSVGGKTWEDAGGLNNEAVMDVPIKFDEMSTSGDYGGHYGKRSIREEVLMIVSSVNAA